MAIPPLTAAMRPAALAQIDVETWRSLGDRFSGDHLQLRTEDIAAAAIVTALFVGGFLILRRLAAWQAATPQRRSPKRLFREIADTHGLRLTERRLCRAIAQQNGLKEPAELFVRVDLRDTLAGADRSLADRLFGPTESD